ncbi:MAG: hypothetical protein K0S70_2342 [Microbacterium sp.]|jgi:hypothetical protein|nr:hypothetical protein [Microbacterium sp.]
MLTACRVCASESELDRKAVHAVIGPVVLPSATREEGEGCGVVGINEREPSATRGMGGVGHGRSQCATAVPATAEHGIDRDICEGMRITGVIPHASEKRDRMPSRIAYDEVHTVLGRERFAKPLLV